MTPTIMITQINIFKEMNLNVKKLRDDFQNLVKSLNNFEMVWEI